MKSLLKETFILAPASILSRAKELKKKGEYKQALTLLERNSVEFNVNYNKAGNDGFVTAKINK